MNETPRQPPASEAASPEDAGLQAEIDALMAQPPRGMPDVIVVGDEAVSAIYLPKPS